MYKVKRILTGIFAVALVLGMQTAVFAAAQSSSEPAAVSSAAQSLTESSAANIIAEPEASADLTSEPAADNADDDNPDTGANVTMLRVSGVLVVLAAAGIAITARAGKRSKN